MNRHNLKIIKINIHLYIVEIDEFYRCISNECLGHYNSLSRLFHNIY